ncbi:unnamed protein product, partial [Tenebrio molitor]
MNLNLRQLKHIIFTINVILSIFGLVMLGIGINWLVTVEKPGILTGAMTT